MKAPPQSERTNRARLLRHGDNPAEGALWNALKSSNLGNHKFVRQYPLGPYFADFAQRQRKLVIEIDGSQHINSTYDATRDLFVQSLGFSVLRVWSGHVLGNCGGVCQTILHALEGQLTTETITSDFKHLPAFPHVERYRRTP
jgi:very-short-patch-repair endonuclease